MSRRVRIQFESPPITWWLVRARLQLADELQQIMARIEPGTKNQVWHPDLDQAKNILKRFNSLEGPTLYPRIIDTECRLQADQGQYILHGNVDVLVAPNVGAGNAVEIWDYKGANRLSVGDPDYQRYVFQMQVYADLYRQKTGTAPSKAVLYFLNELTGDPPPTTLPVNALLEVNLDPAAVQQALQSFGQTVQQIEGCRATRTWPDPAVAPPEKTCSACDLRWNCAAAANLDARIRCYTHEQNDKVSGVHGDGVHGDGVSHYRFGGAADL